MPSLPSFDVRSDLRVEEMVVVIFLLTSGEALKPLEFVKDVAGVFSDLERGAMEGFTWQLISDLCSQ